MLSPDQVELIRTMRNGSWRSVDIQDLCTTIVELRQQLDMVLEREIATADEQSSARASLEIDYRTERDARHRIECERDHAREQVAQWEAIAERDHGAPIATLALIQGAADRLAAAVRSEIREYGCSECHDEPLATPRVTGSCMCSLLDAYTRLTRRAGEPLNPVAYAVTDTEVYRIPAGAVVDLLGKCPCGARATVRMGTDIRWCDDCMFNHVKGTTP